jgi:hypothetical protein
VIFIERLNPQVAQIILITKQKRHLTNFNSSISEDRAWLVVHFIQRSINVNREAMEVEAHTEDTPTDRPDVSTGIDYPTMYDTTDQQTTTHVVPKWTLYNSVITDDKRPITRIQALPLKPRQLMNGPLSSLF